MEFFVVRDGQNLAEVYLPEEIAFERCWQFEASGQINSRRSTRLLQSRHEIIQIAQ